MLWTCALADITLHSCGSVYQLNLWFIYQNFYFTCQLSCYTNSETIYRNSSIQKENRLRCLCVILLTAHFPLSDSALSCFIFNKLTSFALCAYLAGRCFLTVLPSEAFPHPPPSEDGGGPRSLYVLFQSEVFGQTSARHFLWSCILSSGVWGCISLLQSRWAPPHLPAGEGPLPKQRLRVPRHPCAQPNVCTPWSVPSWTRVLHHGVEQMAN